MAKINRYKEQLITHDELLRILRYDPETGHFYWLVSNSKRVKIGDIAGCVQHGYYHIRIKGTLYKAHRLAWFYVNKKWPTECIDHINCNKVDNRLCNLREATYMQNNHNSKMKTNNTSGIKGLSWIEYHQCWIGKITINRQQYTKQSKNKQVCIDWLNEMRPKLHQEFSNNGE